MEGTRTVFSITELECVSERCGDITNHLQLTSKAESEFLMVLSLPRLDGHSHAFGRCKTDWSIVGNY